MLPRPTTIALACFAAGCLALSLFLLDESEPDALLLSESDGAVGLPSAECELATSLREPGSEVSAAASLRLGHGARRPRPEPAAVVKPEPPPKRKLKRRRRRIVRPEPFDFKYATLQLEDGSWSALDESPAATPLICTSLALLGFIGAGETHRYGQHKKRVRGALRWLLGQQRADGGFGGRDEPDPLRADILATAAINELQWIAKSRMLEEPARRGLNWVLDQQAADGRWPGFADAEGRLRRQLWGHLLLRSAGKAELSSYLQGRVSRARERAKSWTLGEATLVRTQLPLLSSIARTIAVEDRKGYATRSDGSIDHAQIESHLANRDPELRFFIALLSPHAPREAKGVLRRELSSQLEHERNVARSGLYRRLLNELSSEHVYRYGHVLGR